ncbi:MAG: aldo/keto reductase [Bacillota bacterium]|nr:aldo/keto reductase [Bacillota bacterium]
MFYRPLGQTDIMVSPITFGALTIGPIHKNLSLQKGADVIRQALDLGVNLIDTAECYETYSYIREALKGYHQEVHVTSKSYAWNRQLMEKAFEEARRELNRDKLDIFLLHEQESGLTIQGHWEAVEYLIEQKAKNRLTAIGISTHAVNAVRAAADLKEMDVIHPLINKYGHGIIDGTRDDMLSAIAYAAKRGKGLYGMKALAGGKLADKAEECCRWAYHIPGLSSFAIGMKSPREVRINVAWALGEEPQADDLAEYIVEKRHIEVTDRCVACGQCLRRCGQRAISLEEDADKAFIDETKCVLCGYCRDNCDQDAISII